MSNFPFFDLIVCTDNNNGIGVSNKLPWDIPSDMAFFKNKTTFTNLSGQYNAIIMGRNTFNSIGKALPNRLNFVISNTLTLINGALIFKSFNDSLKYISHNKNLLNIDNIYVIGGEKLYNDALKHPFLKNIYLSTIQKQFNCDKTFKFNYSQFNTNSVSQVNTLNKLDNTYVDIKYTHLINKNNYEIDYLSLLKKILDKGHFRNTRNGNTYSLFGENLSINLDDNKFPLLTTKKVNLRLIFEELMFFLRGQTDVGILKNKNVNIWNANTTSQFIKEQNLPYQENDTGPMYGFNLIHFGANYIDKDTDYTNKGLNQIDNLIELIIKDKYSRRLLLTTYDPSTAHKGVLYPCHGLVIQFYIEDNNKLSCNMYQRSCDVFLGLPFNISSYALLIYILCDVINNKSNLNLKPGHLNISLGDVHIYDSHIDSVKKQLDNIPFDMPSINFNKKIIDYTKLDWDDVNLTGYDSYGVISAKMIA